MRVPLFSNRRRRLWGGAVLLLLLFRAYVPAGFMPAAGAPFQLELCPSGLQTQTPLSVSMSMPQGHQHAGSHVAFDHCPFGSAPAAGPISQLLGFQPAQQAGSHRASEFRAEVFGARVQRAHQPRGPPFLI
jgi:hypothetical protein